MRSDGPYLKPLDVDVYVRSQSELRLLKSQLPESSVESLAREVIRRLADRESRETNARASDKQIELLCNALLSEDDRAGAEFIQELNTDGVPPEVVYLEYLARAARRLGKWWEEDLISFTNVTVGTSRMYAIMRGMQHRFISTPAHSEKSALFASVPGETHTLGVRMAADLFRRDGWDIDLKIGLSHDDLVAEIKASDTTIIGISAAGYHSINALSQLVIALRISNPSAKVFVSGFAAEKVPDAISLMGVDGSVSDIEAARALMAALWGELSRED